MDNPNQLAHRITISAYAHALTRNYATSRSNANCVYSSYALATILHE